LAASVLAQPATQATDLIAAGADANVPPELADALAAATSPAPHATTTTTLRLSSTIPRLFDRPPAIPL
jgi:hypothetical protein